MVLLFSIPVFSQHKYDFKKAEKDARTYVAKQPDSTFAIIKRTLAQPVVHDTIKGSMYNIYGIYHGMRGNYDSVIYYQKKALTYFKNDAGIKARILVNLCVGYRNKGEHELAINYLNQALEINRRLKDNVGIAVDYGELASVYNIMMDYDKSAQYLVKAIDILKKEKNQERLPALQQKLANTYLAKEKFDFAIDLYEDCLVNFKKQGQMKNYYSTLVNIAEAYIHKNNFKKAKEALSEAINGLQEFGDKSVIGICYAKLGNSEKWLKNPDKAIANYERALKLLTESGYSRTLRIGAEYMALLNEQKMYDKTLLIKKRIDALNQYASSPLEDRSMYTKAAADAYNGTNDMAKALDEYKKTVVLKDSIAKDEQQTAVHEAQAKFQTELQREKNLSLESSNIALKKDLANERKITILYIFGIVCGVILILLVLRSSRLNNRLQTEKIKAIVAEKNMIEQQHKHEQELIAAQRETIDEKQRELTSNTLRMANFQDGVMQLIDKCNTGEIKAVSDLKKELQLLSKQEDYWRQFETRFNHLHPEFGTSLQKRFAKLTKNDIEFCSLLKLNLSNKEIAALLQISHESAITKKYRIKKKMEINDDEEFERMLLEM